MQARRALPLAALAVPVLVALVPTTPAAADDPNAPASAAASSAASPPASASSPSAEPEIIRPVVQRGYTLDRCVNLAELNYPKVAEARAKAAYYRAQLDEARSAPFSQWTMTAGLALAPTIRGTSVYSPNTDVSLTSNMGLAWRAQLDGYVPLWTFGKITNLIDAAESQVKLGEHQIQKEKNQVKLDVRKAYFGLILARASRDLLRESADKLDDAIRKLQKSIDKGEGDEIDLLKLRTFRAELDARVSEAERMQTIALAGLKFLTGATGDFDIAGKALLPPKHQLGPVATYLQAARLNRPEVNMARAGVEARRAQLELARARLYPDVGVGLSAGWTRAPEVADQLNPYVLDNANYMHYGFALGMRWTLDFLPASARIQQAQAQLEETRAIERTALGGVGFEVESAYAEVADALKRERAYADAEKYAKQWMIAVQQGIDIGTEDEKDLIDPAKQYATQRFNHLNAIMDLDVAMSKLALVTGWDAIAPEG